MDVSQWKAMAWNVSQHDERVREAMCEAFIGAYESGDVDEDVLESLLAAEDEIKRNRQRRKEAKEVDRG